MGERRSRRRVAFVSGIALLVAFAVWAAFVRGPSRYDVDGLSCSSSSYSSTAVDFQSGPPSWASAREALDYSLKLNPSVPADGWVLTLETDRAIWERHDDDGHLVGRSVHRRTGNGWEFAVPHVCTETRLDVPAG